MTSQCHCKNSVSEHRLGVLLVDDHPALRAGLRSLLSTESDIEVIGEATSGEEAWTRYRAIHPNVVIMDLSMAGFGGIEAIRRIRQFDPEARILVYSVHSTDIMLYRALALGALGYVTKASDSALLIQGIRALAQRRGFVSPDMIPAMVRKHLTEEQPVFEKLTPREFTVFLLTAEGKKPEECASSLNLSEKTIRNYLTRIKLNLEVDDTASLTRLAIRAGLVNP